jgi:hypothetical protein
VTVNTHIFFFGLIEKTRLNRKLKPQLALDQKKKKNHLVEAFPHVRHGMDTTLKDQSHNTY